MATRWTNGIRLPAGMATSEKAYWMPILEVLEHVGRAPVYHVRQEVWFIMEEKLNKYDYDPISLGRERWQNKMGWAAKKMKIAGLLEDGLPRGVWGITEKGRQTLRARRGRSEAA